MTNNRTGTSVEVERLRWSLAEVKKEVTAVTPDWARVMRIFDEAGPCRSDGSLVLRVCTAYEQGFGQAGRALDNPYEMLSAEAEAWNIGWQEGKKRTPEPPGDADRLRALIRRVLEWRPALPVESSLLDELSAAVDGAASESTDDGFHFGKCDHPGCTLPRYILHHSHRRAE